MKKETAHNSTAKQKQTKRSSYSTDPDCYFSWRKTPISRSLIEKMIEELPDWPDKHPMRNSLTEFYFAYHITKTTMQGLLKRHPDLKEAHDIAMIRIGERAYDRSLLRQYDWTATKFRIHRYGEEFVEDKEMEAALKAKSDKNAGFSGVINITGDTMQLKKNPDEEE